MTIGNRLLHLCTIFSLVLCASIAGAASAQSYPIKPIRIIVAAPPGGGSDRTARMLGEKLLSAFGQQVIVENRGGGSTNIASELAAKASPDGYTLYLCTPAVSINPSLFRKLSYDTLKDFAPITQVVELTYIFVVNPSVPAKTVKEFIAFAKSQKGGITYASAGMGAPGHLGMELLKILAGFDAVHVPYNGAGPTMVALIAGEAVAHISTMPSGLPHVRSGRIRAIALTSLKRSVLLPDVPTIAESGFPGFEIVGWYGLLAPAGTPREVVVKLYKEVSGILKLPDVRDRLSRDGADPVGTTPEELAAYIKAEMIKYAKVVKQSGAKMD